MPEPIRRGTHLALQGALWAFVAAAFHSLVPVAVRMLSDTMPSIEIVFLRNLIGLAALLVFFVWRGFGSLRTERIMVHAQRNLLNFVRRMRQAPGEVVLVHGEEKAKRALCAKLRGIGVSCVG